MRQLPPDIRSHDPIDYALDNHIREGVWGGLTERERRKLEKAS